MALLIVGRGVAELGQKWRAIAGRLPGRSDDAVRNRWKRLAKARPSPNDPEGAFLSAKPREPIRRPPRAAWSLEEDQTIVEMVERLGFKWGKIEQVLEGRTSHAIRNRFYRTATAAAAARAAARAARRAGAAGARGVGPGACTDRCRCVDVGRPPTRRHSAESKD